MNQLNPFVREDIVNALVQEARARGPLPAENDGMPSVHQSDRSRAIRRISEIVNVRGWHLAVTRELDRRGASYVSDLSDDAIYGLCARMEYLEDCVQTGCDSQDAPPAR